MLISQTNIITKQASEIRISKLSTCNQYSSIQKHKDIGVSTDRTRVQVWPSKLP